MKRIFFAAFIVAVMVAGDVGFLDAVDMGEGKTYQLKKVTNTAGLPVRTKMNINDVSSWYDSDGTEEINSATGNSGLVYPQGTAGVIFTAGLMWSGEFNDGLGNAIRTNGHSYNTGLTRGRINGVRTGDIEDPEAGDVRIWRVRRNYNTADLRRDAAELNEIGISSVTEAQVAAVRAQYETDWLEWPAAKGAPFYDADSDGVYAPQIVGGVPTLYPDADEPGVADADQVIWYVANDIGGTSPWGAVATGLEMQLTVWGYARTDALGAVLFKKYRLIYKGTATTPSNADITNMYLSQWSDPDLGAFSDDYAGCDTVLSLGFIYNANAQDAQFSAFGIAPPAAGYDFLQGPLVPGVAGQDLNKNGIDDAGDTGIFDLKRTGPGFINLPMTAFLYFAAGGVYSDPPFNFNGGLQWNCMLQGLPPTPQPPPCPVPPQDPYAGRPAGNYWLYAGSDGSSAPNPNAPTGWVDGMVEGPGDRRIILASGPFTMALGDTQELVSAVVGGLGTTNLKSIQVMKFNDRSVQLAYDNLFNLPKPPTNPDTKVTSLDKKIILDWESNQAAVDATEIPVYQGGYAFEGYKVYQLPNASAGLSDGILLATFDIINGVKTIFQETFDPVSGEILNLPVQFGTDNGIQRTFTVTRDEFRSTPLVNGTTYYFAVTAYNYTPQNQPIKTLESAPLVVTAIPSTPDPGTRYPYDEGEEVEGVSDLVGVNDAGIMPVVFNPTRQAGEVYEVHFDTLANGSLVWDFFSQGQPDTLFAQIPVSADSTIRLVTTGITIQVSPPLQGAKSVLSEGENVFGPSGIPAGAGYRVLGKSTDINSLAGGGKNTGRTYEIRFNDEVNFALSSASPGFFSQVVRVPFAVYDMGRGPEDTPRRVMPAVKDVGTTRATWNVSSELLEQDGVSFTVFEPIFASTLTYVDDNPSTPTREDSAAVKTQQTNLIAVTSSATNTRNAVDSLYIADLDDNGIAAPSGTTIAVNKYLEIRKGDVKQIQLESVVTGDLQAARDDVTLINVFPNPYYGLNTRETSSEVRFVTFNHLPARAVIRIFNLAGVLVRTLTKDSGNANPNSSQHFTWDLQNDSGLPVASGIYVCHLELSDENGQDLGTKILKLAIIQEQQFLRNY
jgi:hypothetical protein